MKYQLYVYGLGRMGHGLAERLASTGLLRGVFNRTFDKAELFAQDHGVSALTDVSELDGSPNAVLLCLPAGEATEEVFQALLGQLKEGDVIIDGGNANVHDSLRRSEVAKQKGLHFVDAGVSGGVLGRERGYCLMIGGEESLITELSPLWNAVSCPDGWRHVGPAGAGHYVKMVHNGIEYGVMQAYAEGVSLLKFQSLIPNMNIEAATEIWQRGSIITSQLGELVEQAIHNPESIEGASPQVSHTGEAAWMVEEAAREQVAVPVIAQSLEVRKVSPASDPAGQYAGKLLSVLRNLFGGHSVG